MAMEYSVPMYCIHGRLKDGRIGPGGIKNSLNPTGVLYSSPLGATWSVELSYKPST